MLVLKGWNLWMNWVMFRIRNQKVTWLDKLLRTLLSIGIFYFLLEKHFFIIIVAVFFFSRVFNYFFFMKKFPILILVVLIEKEIQRFDDFFWFVVHFLNFSNIFI